MPSTEFEMASRAINHHQSSLDSLLGCGRRYWAEYLSGMPPVGKPAAAAGTGTHAAVEAHERARIAGNPDGITLEEMYAVARASLLDQAGTFSADQLASFEHVRPGKGSGKNKTQDEVHTGIEALIAQSQDAVWQWWHAPITSPDDPEVTTTCREWTLTLTPLSVEQYLKGEMDGAGRPLAGTVDGIYWDEARQCVRLVDIKTANKLTYWKKADEHRTQAAFYAFLLMIDDDLKAVSDRLPVDYLVTMTYVVARRGLGKTKAFQGATTLTVAVDHHDLAKLGARVRAADAKLASGVLLPNPTYKWCADYSCPIWDYCIGGDRTLMGTLDQARARVAELVA